MKAHIGNEKGNIPYSAIGSVLMLLTAGIIVKIGAAIQLASLNH